MSMKLTGEYEFTNDGVRIIGQVHNTKIPLVREAINERMMIEMYQGDAPGMNGDQYWVPNPLIYDSLKVNGAIKGEELAKVLNLPKDYNVKASSCSVDLMMAGVLYSRAGTAIMKQVPLSYNVLGSAYQRKRVKRPVFNVPWIYRVADDGTFDVTLKGMVNRHILTMLLGRATTFAKFLDGPVAEAVKDSKALESAVCRGAYL